MWRSRIILLGVELSLLITPSCQRFSVPFRFEPNAGQAPASVKYIANGSRYNALLDETGLTIGSSAHPIHVRFAGASKPLIEPVHELDVQSNYYTGEPRQWRTGIRSFQRLLYRSVYSGVDVLFYGNGSELQFDFVLAPNAVVENIRLAFSGQQGLELSDSNELWLRAKDGKVRITFPGIYQVVDGQRKGVNGRFVKRAGNTVASP
jgi:hypothetical protein